MEASRLKGLSNDIKCGTVEQKIIGGEVVLKIDRGENLATMPTMDIDKEKYAFAVYVIRYDS